MYTKTKELGRGCCGSVYEGLRCVFVFICSVYNGRLVAIKEIITRDDPRKKKEFFREVEIMATLHDPSVVRIYGFNVRQKSETELVYTMIMEKAKTNLGKPIPIEDCENGLSGDVIRLRNDPNAYKERKLYILQIASGLYCLYLKRVCHGDLKLDNILVSEEGDLKISDFGLSRMINDGLLSTVVELGNRYQ